MKEMQDSRMLEEQEGEQLCALRASYEVSKITRVQLMRDPVEGVCLEKGHRSRTTAEAETGSTSGKQATTTLQMLKNSPSFLTVQILLQFKHVGMYGGKRG